MGLSRFGWKLRPVSFLQMLVFKIYYNFIEYNFIEYKYISKLTVYKYI